MNPVLEYIRARLGKPDALAALTVFSVTPLGRWSLAEWSGAVAALSGDGAPCRSWREVAARLTELTRYEKIPFTSGGGCPTIKAE